MYSKTLSRLLLTLSLSSVSSAWALDISSAPEGAKAYIIAPSNGAVVTSPVLVKFGLKAMGVAPAGVNRDGTGHHHLLVDVDSLPAMEQPLPSSAQLRHFGKGQTEVELELAPGTHSLQLLLGNYLHIPHNKPVLSEKITITVR